MVEVDAIGIANDCVVPNRPIGNDPFAIMADSAADDLGSPTGTTIDPCSAVARNQAIGYHGTGVRPRTTNACGVGSDGRVVNSWCSIVNKDAALSVLDSCVSKDGLIAARATNLEPLPIPNGWRCAVRCEDDLVAFSPLSPERSIYIQSRPGSKTYLYPSLYRQRNTSVHQHVPCHNVRTACLIPGCINADSATRHFNRTARP